MSENNKTKKMKGETNSTSLPIPFPSASSGKGVRDEERAEKDLLAPQRSLKTSRTEKRKPSSISHFIPSLRCFSFFCREIGQRRSGGVGENLKFKGGIMKYQLRIKVDGEFETRRKKTKERIKEREDAIDMALREIVRSKVRRIGGWGDFSNLVTIEPKE